MGQGKEMTQTEKKTKVKQNSKSVLETSVGTDFYTA